MRYLSSRVLNKALYRVIILALWFAYGVVPEVFTDNWPQCQPQQSDRPRRMHHMENFQVFAIPYINPIAINTPPPS